MIQPAASWRFNLLAFLLILTLPLHAGTAPFAEGKDFRLIQAAPASSQKAGAIRVEEFFSYGCPWCYKLEPALEQWVRAKGNSIRFQRTPVVFNPAWTFYAKAWYTAKALGEENRLTPLLFQAIQHDKRPLDSNESMVAFLVQHGVDQQIATSAFAHSTTIDMALERANTHMRAYQIMVVPALVVGGRYKTDLQMAKTPERLFAILDYLIDHKMLQNPKSSAG